MSQSPLTRQAIAKHLPVLHAVGLVESVRAGREVRFRVFGAELSAAVRRLDAIAWVRRLAETKSIAESSEAAGSDIAASDVTNRNPAVTPLPASASVDPPAPSAHPPDTPPRSRETE